MASSAGMWQRRYDLALRHTSLYYRSMRYHLLSIIALVLTVGCAGTDKSAQTQKLDSEAARWEQSVRQQIPNDAQVFVVIPDVGRLGLDRALDKVALVPWLAKHKQTVIDNVHTLITQEILLDVRKVHALAAFVRMGEEGWGWGLAAGPIDSTSGQLPPSCTLTEQLMRCGTPASVNTKPNKSLPNDIQVWASLDAAALTHWLGGPSMFPHVDKIELRITDTLLTVRAYGSDIELRRLEKLARDSLGKLGATAMYGGVSRIMSMVLSPFLANIREQLQASYGPGELTLAVPVSSGGALVVVGGVAWFTLAARDDSKKEAPEMSEPATSVDERKADPPALP